MCAVSQIKDRLKPFFILCLDLDQIDRFIFISFALSEKTSSGDAVPAFPQVLLVINPGRLAGSKRIKDDLTESLLECVTRSLLRDEFNLQKICPYQ